MTEQKNEQKKSARVLLDDGNRRPWYVRTLIWGCAVALVGGGVYAWMSTRPDPNAVSYVTQVVERGPISVTVSADGTLNPMRTVTLGSELSGIVRKVNVDVNDEVKTGQTLIELDTRNLEAKVSSAKAALTSAKAQLKESEATLNEAKLRYDRLKELNRISEGHMPTRAELDQQEASVETARASVEVSRASIADAEATLDTAETDLGKAMIASPIDGVVLARSVEPGYAVAASLQAVELLTLATDLRELELRVDVDEADIGVVAAGQDAYFTVSSYPDRRFPAVLKKVAYGSTETENVVTYTTYLNVDNKDLLLRPGMTASATISTAHKDDVLLVPNAALRFQPRQTTASTQSALMMGGPPHASGEKSVKETSLHGERIRTIYVLRNGQALPLEVTTGLTDGSQTEIVSGELAEGDEVIVDQRRAGK